MYRRLAVFLAIVALAFIFVPVAGSEYLKTIASFDFKEGQLEAGFDNWIYSDQGVNACNIYRGGQTGYFCGKNSKGENQSLFIHYLTYNNDHMGWLRWGYLDAETHLAVKGSSLKLVLTGGAYGLNGKIETSGKPVKSKTQLLSLEAQQINPYADRPLPGDATLYFKTGSSNTPFEILQGANRLGLWVLMPRSGQGFDTQQHTKQKRRPDYTFAWFPFIDDSRKGHYYHGITNIPMGGWVRVAFDAHPNHYNGGIKNPYAYFRPGGYEAPGEGQAYFNRMVTFAFRAPFMRHQPSPVAMYLDEITAYRKDHENEETISSVAIGFDPQARRFDISFNDKYRCLDCSASYLVKYAFSPIDQAGFDKAKPCRVTNFRREKSNANGLIFKPNSGYNQIWAGLEVQPADKALLKEGAKIYFAVKDISDRSHLPERDPHDNDPVDIPGTGPVPHKDLIRTLAYTIYPVPWPLGFTGIESVYTIQTGQTTGVRFKASGGTPPYLFFPKGDLPPGLFLEAGGTLTGKTSTPGQYQFTLNVVDKTHKRLARKVVLEVLAP